MAVGAAMTRPAADRWKAMNMGLLLLAFNQDLQTTWGWPAATTRGGNYKNDPHGGCEAPAAVGRQLGAGHSSAWRAYFTNPCPASNAWAVSTPNHAGGLMKAPPRQQPRASSSRHVLL